MRGRTTNDYILGAEYSWLMTVPTGPILENLVPDDGYQSWKLYWLGKNPYEVQDKDETLIALLHNEETDEILAFRTSLAMLESGKGGVDVSLYIFRDSKSDRMGEEKYNILFFDMPEGQKPLVMLITNVLDERELEMPGTMKVRLRSAKIAGADLPAYSLSDHLFIMCDGTDGTVSLFDGFYTNTFDGDIFDSNYLRIEGIRNNNLKVTIKQDQEVWPEKTDETHATDLNGTQYELVVWEWKENKDEPEDPARAA